MERADSLDKDENEIKAEDNIGIINEFQCVACSILNLSANVLVYLAQVFR
jgi:hypothetical protein